MKRALVTGGGGFVGSHIVRLLLALGVECLALGRNPYPELQKMGAITLQGDICDAAFLEKSFAGVDTVFHVAALAGIWGSGAEYYRINVQGTKNVIAACKATGVLRLVQTSTPSVVFNGNDIVQGDETLPYAHKFLCHYAKTKAIAEQLVLAEGASGKDLVTCAIRPHLVWGPGDPHLIPRLLARGRMGKLKKVGNSNNLVDISYVDNVAESHILAAENLKTTQTANGQAYFISQGEPVNLWEWIDKLFVDLSVPEIKSHVPYGVAYMAGAILEAAHHLFNPNKEPQMTRFLAEQLAKSHCFSINKARKDLGYSPKISTQEGMARLAAFYANQKEES